MTNAPVRPAITLPFAFAFMLWASCAAALSAGVGISWGTCAKAAAVSLAAGALAIPAALRFKRPFPCAVAAGLFVGLALGFGQAAHMHEAVEAVAGMEGLQALELEIASDSREGSYGSSAYARVCSPALEGELAVVSLPKGAELLCGDRISLEASLKPADYARSPRLWQEGVTASLEVEGGAFSLRAPSFAFLRELRRRGIAAFEGQGDASALLQALVCGYRADLAGTRLYAAFQTCGLAHLVAVSGAHLVIVTSLFAGLFKALRFPRRLSAGALVLLMFGYYVMAGMPVSAFRAATMSSVGLLSILGRRRPSAQNALGIAVIGILATRPSSALSASFALSALATAGIVLFAPLVQSGIEGMLPRPRAVVEALALTIASGILAQPLASSLFSQLPLIAPLANIAAAPMFAPLCALSLSAALASAAHVPFAYLLVKASVMGAGFSCGVVEALSAVPYASVPVYLGGVYAIALSAFAAACIWAFWDRLRPGRVAGAAALCFCAVFGIGFVQAQGDSISMLDVGQGDAILIRSAGETLLVDTGNQDTRLLEQLAQCGVAHIDSVLVTHADDDHRGSLDAIAQAVDVDRVMVARGIIGNGDASCASLVSDARHAARQLVELAYGDVFAVGRFKMEVVWPKSLEDDGGNADSLCLLARYDADSDGEPDLTALFTGDAEKEEVAAMIAEGTVGAVDILKVGHHGSRNGLTEDEAAVLSPRIGLIGVGARNRYGHPTQEALDILEGVGCRVFRTDEDGMVRCLVGKDSVRVRIGAPSPFA